MLVDEQLLLVEQGLLNDKVLVTKLIVFSKEKLLTEADIVLMMWQHAHYIIITLNGPRFIDFQSVTQTKMRHVIANLKTKLGARTPLVDNDIKTDKLCGEELTKAIACEHEKFKTNTKEKMESVLANFTGTYDEMSKETLYKLLAHGVKNEEKKNKYEFEREDVLGIVDYIREQLSNEVKLLSGKKNSFLWGSDVANNSCTWCSFQCQLQTT